MSNEANTIYIVPDDSRAYEGVLTKRIMAFIVDYLLILLLCIPAAIVLFVFSIITLGLGFMLYPALFVMVAIPYFGFTLGGSSQASPGMKMMGLAMTRSGGRQVDFLLSTVHIVLFWIVNSILTPLVLLVGLFTERSRLVHDFLLGTTIVRSN
jgi:uncharacterized RDD family membrane protein YckC